jgi:hypothetical protein
MRIASKAAILSASILAAGGAVAQSTTPTEGQPMNIGGVETVCTGTTTDVRDDPRWQAYSLRLEFAGKDGQYLGDEMVNVAGNGQSVSVHCAGPWVLMNLPKGAYKVSADVAGAGHQDLTVQAPGRVIVRFPNAGGETAPAGSAAPQRD